MVIEVNNIYCKCSYTANDLSLDFDLHKKLVATFREKSDKARFASAGGWDGYVNFYTPATKKFATGFLPLVVKYCKSWGVEVELKDNRKNLPVFKNPPVKTFGEITLRDDQYELLCSLNNYIDDFYFPRGVLDAATNAGKTVISLGLFNNLENPKMIFLVRRFDLFTQTVEFFEKHLGQDRVGTIFSKQGSHPNKRWKKASYDIKELTVAMVPSLLARLGKNSINVVKDLKTFNTLLVDECHYSTAKTEKKLLGIIEAGMRLFVSGTVFSKNSDKINKLVLRGMSGQVLGKISNMDLMESGVSRKVDVHLHLSCETASNFLTYRQEVKTCIHTSKVRAEIIYNELQQSQDKYVLIIYDSIEHGEFLYNYLMSKNDYTISTVLTHGQDKERFKKVQSFLNKQVNVLLVISKIMREGINMPHVSTIIYANGGISDIAIKQWIGRGLRTGDFDDRLKVVDFYDIGKNVKRHSNKRLAIYEEEGFNVVKHFDLKSAKRLTNNVKFKK